VLFHDRVHQALKAAVREGTGLAVLTIDLDRFKEINETLGHHNGDLLLCTVGARLGRALRGSDSVARLGGDEFAVLVTDVSGVEDALEAAARVRAAISERLDLEEIGVEVEASVGIALYPEHGDDPETLLQHADVAMYAAKQAHSGHAVYDGAIDRYSRDNLGLIADLRRAIDEDELVLHFQPKAEVATGRIVGVEALVRWDHPERGFLFPDAFIPLAENTGLIRPLTLHILDRALAQCRTWSDDGLVLGMAVNVSTRNLLDLTLPDEVDTLLQLHGVPAAQLELEITETTIMADPPRAKAVLARLSAMGVDLAVDDFGTGYTSLGHLKELPIDKMKIDRSFVHDLPARRDSAAIAKAIIQMARSLGITVIAEGVETEAQRRFLANEECDELQGNAIGQPMDGDTLRSWVAECAPRTLALHP
jgi:diguanylate cyclase